MRYAAERTAKPPRTARLAAASDLRVGAPAGVRPVAHPVVVGAVGTHTTLSSTALSSRIRNSAMTFTGITQRGNVGSLTHTIASSGSPSSPTVSGMKP